MPRATPLKLIHTAQPTPTTTAPAGDAGPALDWGTIPDALDERGRAYWIHLALTYGPDPSRFLEGERGAVTMFCQWSGLAEAAAEDLHAEGLKVAGRSSADGGREVKNPLHQVFRDASLQVERWARQCRLTPASRPVGTPTTDDDNPF